MVTQVGEGEYLLSKFYLGASKMLLDELDLIQSLCLIRLFKWKTFVIGSSMVKFIDFSFESFHIESLVDYTF